MKGKLLGIGAALICAAQGSWVLSQVNLERFQRQLESIQRETRVQADQAIPTDQRALIDYGAYLNALFIAFPQGSQDHLLQQYQAVAFARVNLDNAQEFYVRGRYTNRIFSQRDPFNDLADEENQIDRLYYRFDLKRYLASTSGQTIGGDLSVQVGRQLVNWGNGLVFSEPIDGGVIDASLGNLTAEFLGGRTYYNTADIDPFRPNYIDHTDRMFWGSMLSYQLPRHRPFIYFLHQQDENGAGPYKWTDDTGTLQETHFKYDSYYIGTGSSGNITDHLLYSVELVYEGGSTLSANTGAAGTQGTDDIRAYAGDVRLDYLFNDPHDTRWTEEFIAATGDSDRGISNSTYQGNQKGTIDNAFNGFGLLNTGFAFSPAVSNILVLRSGISTYPWSDVQALRRLQVGADFLLYSKMESGAPIDEPTDADFWLGSEIDLSATWQITSDVAVLLRYGLYFPGSAIDTGRNPRNFIAVGMTYAF